MWLSHYPRHGNIVGRDEILAAVAHWCRERLLEIDGASAAASEWWLVRALGWASGSPFDVLQSGQGAELQPGTLAL